MVEFAATTLKGPYRFKGEFQAQGEKREVQFSTSEQDQLGKIRVKSVIEAPKTRSRYVLDGELYGLDSTPTLKGEISGETPIDWLSIVQREDGYQNVAYNAAPSESRIINLRARLNATLKRFEFQDLSLSVADSKRPQSINGVAIFDWKNGFNLKTRLKANWLDFDKMLVSQDSQMQEGDKPQKSSRKTVNMAFNLIKSLLQNMGESITRAAVQVDVTEARLGGSALNNFNFHLTKDTESFQISKLSVGLPGRNQLDLRGNLISKQGDITFSGPVSIRGISLGCFISLGPV